MAKSGVGRRAVLKGGAALLLVKGQAFGAQGDAAAIRPKEGDFLVKVDAPGAKPLTPDDVPAGGHADDGLAARSAWTARCETDRG